MKVLHLASLFFPKVVGGKEVFISNLIMNNPEHEHLVVIQDEKIHGRYVHKGIQVEVLPMAETKDKRASYFSLVFDALPGFGEVLDNYKPDIVHFHDFCSGASLSHLRMCASRGIKTLVTYHSPGNSCLQKGLIRNGTEPCDGKILMHRCTQCRYESKSASPWLAWLLASVEPPFDKAGKVFFRNSTRLFKNSFEEFFNTVDVIQVHATWVKRLFITNGIKESKIHMIDLGGNAIDKPLKTPRDINEPLKIGFAGRCTAIKGVEILIDAIRMIPAEHKLEVHFLGPYWNDEYGTAMSKKIEGDSRFKSPRLVAPELVVTELSKLDVAAIPSTWPETGPITVFDAFAAGLPIIGTNHAGIAERVEDGVDGLLFRWGDSSDLKDKLMKVITDRPYLEKLRSNIRKQKTVREFSLNLADLYSQTTGIQRT